MIGWPDAVEPPADELPPPPGDLALDEADDPLLSVAALARYRRGGSFILDTPADPVPLWGRGQSVLWAEGEALVVVGGQGTGKTTLAQQLALGRAGFTEYAELLELPIAEGAGPVLYLAMDRPRQIARSFRRMIGDAWREELDQRLTVWPGPPAVDLARHPGALARMAETVGATTVVVDSLKDAAIGLTDDEVGAGWNRARQIALAAGVQVLEVHHNRKAISGSKAAGPGIDEVYGSTWITSGAGSVLLLAGRPGDPVIGLHHLKQPAEEVGPLRVVHDHDAGRSSVWSAVDLAELVLASPAGLTKTEAARAMFDTDDPSPAEQEKARRRLRKLTSQGLVCCLDEGDAAAKRPARWGPIGNHTRTTRGVPRDEPLATLTDSTKGEL